MTAPTALKSPATVLVPFGAGVLVAIALGVYGKVHTPAGEPLFQLGFPSMMAMKVWMTTLTLVLALVQVLSALWMYGKLGGSAPSWVGPLHKTSGTLAFLASVPVALHCLWSLGFAAYNPEFPDSARAVAHSLFGCLFYGAFVAKILTLKSRKVPGWALPWVGGLVFTTLVAVGLTSAVWYFAVRGVPS